MPTLADLLGAAPGARLLRGDPTTTVTGITNKAQAVRPGDLYVAIRGARFDGRDFAPEAVGRGAPAVVHDGEAPLGVGPAEIVVADARAALGPLAAAVYGHPSRDLRLVGVTGTDGKTTTTHLVAAVLAARGLEVGRLSTVSLRVGSEEEPNALQHTTPEAGEVQRLLARMRDAGCRAGVLEVSSHALAMGRVAGCRFDVAVFTNLTPEHLNFHGSMEAYAAAKARLFAMLGQRGEKPGPAYGVVNADDPRAAVMAAACPAPVRRYALDAPAEVTARDLVLDLDGARFLLATPAGERRVRTRLLGRFNVYNWLAAATVALAEGMSLDHLAEVMACTPPVPGRMQQVLPAGWAGAEAARLPFHVFVDFAHTPGALRNALATLRPLTPGRILLCFGLAGERDAANRPTMGGIAAAMADFTVISTDDPYHEDPAEIAAAIVRGLARAGRQEGRDYQVILDRRVAIRALLERVRPGDCVLLAGKGHERRMMVGDRALPWSDAEEAAAALAHRLGA